MLLDHFLLEQGDDLLLESGAWILLEDAGNASVRVRVTEFSGDYVALLEGSGDYVTLFEASEGVP